MSIYFSHCFYVHFISFTFSTSCLRACLDSVTSWVQPWLHLERSYWQTVFLFPVSDFSIQWLTQFLTFVSEIRNLGIVLDPPSFPSALWFSLRLSLSSLGMQSELVLNMVLPPFSVFVPFFSCLIRRLLMIFLYALSAKLGNLKAATLSCCCKRIEWSLLLQDVELNIHVFCHWFPITAKEPCKTRT